MEKLLSFSLFFLFLFIEFFVRVLEKYKRESEGDIKLGNKN